MATQKRYLNATEIQTIIGQIVFDPAFVPASLDTYNETAVVEAIAKTKRQPELAMAAVNMACIGYGQQKYGAYRFKEESKDIALLLKACGVRINLGKDAKLNDGELTPQRICRAFRYEIRKYVQANDFETYLYRKYSTHDPKYADICFRGAEYLDDLTPDEVDYLLALYEKLDAEKKSTVLERVKRVFQAKGYMKRTIKNVNV